MEVIIEKICSIFILTLGLSYLLNASRWISYFKQMLEDKEQIFLLGIIILLLGSTLVVTHNIWVNAPIVIVTLFGWLLLLKGLSMMLFPGMLNRFQKLSDAFLSNILFINGILFTAVGGILFYLLFLG